MTYLQRINYAPAWDTLTDTEFKHLQRFFKPTGQELIIFDQVLHWEHIDEVEVVVAPHIKGLAGWITKRLFYSNEERYHVGIYFGSGEAILPNITWNTARFVLENIAFYTKKSVVYRGPEDLVLLSEI